MRHDMWRTYGAQISVISDQRSAIGDQESGRKSAPLKGKGMRTQIPIRYAESVPPAGLHPQAVTV